MCGAQPAAIPLPHVGTPPSACPLSCLRFGVACCPSGGIALAAPPLQSSRLCTHTAPLAIAGLRGVDAPSIRSCLSRLPSPLPGKAAGEDKKLGKVLEKQYKDEATAEPTSPVVTATPLGDMSSVSTRRLLINLIATLNASFPDYDFRCERAGAIMPSSVRALN